MDKIEKIRQEIERHLNSAIEHQNANPDMPKHKWYLYEGAKELCTDLLGYLDDTFSEEPDIPEFPETFEICLYDGRTPEKEKCSECSTTCSVRDESK